MGDVDSGRCKKFGDQCTADYSICYDRSHPKPSPSAPAEDLVYEEALRLEQEVGSAFFDPVSKPNSANAGLVMVDRATSWIACYPHGTRQAGNVLQSYTH